MASIAVSNCEHHILRIDHPEVLPDEHHTAAMRYGCILVSRAGMRTVNMSRR